MSYNRVCDKEEIVNSSNLQLILFKVLKRVYHSSLNLGQLKRKCEDDYVISLIFLWLPKSKKLLEEGVTNFRIQLLKTKIFEFRRIGSKLCHSVIVEGKKEFLKMLVVMFKKGMLLTFLVAYPWVFSGISSKRYWGLLLL